MISTGPADYSAAPPKVAIAGAGLLGRLLAWRLLRIGCEVALFDSGQFGKPRSAAHTAAAMISPMSEVVVSERSIYNSGVRSLALWPVWLEQLSAAELPPVGYSANGSLVVAHPQDDAELQQFYRDLQFHLGADNSARWLDRSELARLEPDLAGQFQQGLYLPGEAFLDNRQLLDNLLSAIRHLGGQCHEQQAVSFTPGARTDERSLAHYDFAIDTRGLGAKQNLAQLRGVRGEVLWVETPEVHFNRAIRLMHPRYKIYVVPRPNNRFIIGATEIESEDASPVSVQSMLELCSALYTLNPAFAEARIVELDANLRPCHRDNLPHIDWQLVPVGAGRHQRIVRINGLYRHGFLLAPTLVDQVVAELGEQWHANHNL